ncbi:MAG: hypothetical protein LBE06_00830 [Azoarcus sp.]|jgi:hypothetical protein|nr:hypothetical protein [Azoarcus sp.]
MEIIPQELQEALIELFSIYGLAEESFKKTQEILSKLDISPLNEFRYCSRNLIEFLRIAVSQEDDIDKLKKIIQQATHAAKNALNDCLDLAVDRAAAELGRLRDIDKEKDLSYYVPNEKEVKGAIGVLHDKIAESRRDLVQRVEVYRQLYDSEAFKIIAAFANKQNLKSIEERIRIDERHMTRDTRRFWLTIVIGLLGIAGLSNLAKLLG